MPHRLSILHRLIALILAVLLLLPMVLPAIWGSWYTWGNESFSRSFCVNFEEPATMCNGQCQMEELAMDWSNTTDPQEAIAPSTERNLTYLSEPLPELNLAAKAEVFFQPLRIEKMGEKRGGYRAAVFRPPPARHFV